MRHLSPIVIVCLCAIAPASQTFAQAYSPYGTSYSTKSLATPARADESEDPSMLSYAFRGLLSGGLIGLAGGYVGERNGGEDWDQMDWRAVGIWSGAGGAAGLLLGLSLGSVDRTSDYLGAGHLVLSNMLGGALMGGVAGAVGGGFYAAADENNEHSAFGSAIGVLGGAGIGLLVGLVQAPQVEKRGARVQPTVITRQSGRDRPVLLLGASGQF